MHWRAPLTVFMHHQDFSKLRCAVVWWARRQSEADYELLLEIKASLTHPQQQSWPAQEGHRFKTENEQPLC